ncbi:hypothetical protein ACFR99_00725 [Haloarchaeobius amylolyticus]|uniref:Uncharacterized protein n=1 Tax=Haloarchaeobius amylolyticus TaxID=1198296 RepID=A0ABD6BAN9_9EURY
MFEHDRRLLIPKSPFAELTVTNLVGVADEIRRLRIGKPRFDRRVRFVLVIAEQR